MRERFGRFGFGWRLFVLFLLLASTFSYAMFQGGFVSWFLFYVFLPFGLYAVLFAFYPLKTFEAERKLSRGQLKAGDPFEAVITLKRKFPFPLMFLIVEDCLPASLLKNGHLSEAKTFLFPWFQKEIKMVYTIPSVPRGDHRLTAVRIRTGDPLGLLEKEVYLQIETSFLVLPSYQEITYRENAGSFDDKGGHAVDFQRQNSNLASGVREYQPGDRVSWVDWKTSARRNSLMTKEFEQVKGRNLYIFMDRSPSPVFEDIVVFTASVVRAALQNGTYTGLVSIGKERTVFPVRSGEDHLRKLFYHLALADCDSSYPFHSLLEKELHLPDIAKTVKYIMTSRMTPELSRVLGNAARDKAPAVFVIKEKGDALSPEESAAIEYVTARGIEVSVIAGDRFSHVFAKAR
ncbi:DUF58 domain-containing protein [Bacillus sonorensis]|uniref:DUF58 domain-containing protein n=2 Tax=Bacillus sonorensis TaxID=119858 RepID=M5P644_9BACI|nr:MULTISPECIES: DUF58 domain-containing protein [Bacillus]TWK74662.1 hypothetical protein CHCC20335_3076 [Bacillus paralicheniformis]ASB87434.1 uncharacterized protein S101395_00880 [Bacillus sonorensis]EME75466.1 hypothetical protein BSONL12_06518 [Bacillus sonorensis L12]MCF7616896.1 DUF58 domain-containing protein [Bacillus sonorensis]MCY8035711.1 DUF58 domain-containing protein [Bacillus sonorensis]